MPEASRVDGELGSGEFHSPLPGAEVPGVRGAHDAQSLYEPRASGGNFAVSREVLARRANLLGDQAASVQRPRALVAMRNLPALPASC